MRMGSLAVGQLSEMQGAGLLVTGLSKKIKANGPSRYAECMEVREVIFFARSLELAQIVWQEIPQLVVFKAIATLCLHMRLVLEDIRHEPSLFRKVEYSTVHRTENCKAHHLARNAIFSLIVMYEWKCPPSSLCPHLLQIFLLINRMPPLL